MRADNRTRTAWIWVMCFAIAAALSGQARADDPAGWKLAFSDDFERDHAGADWKVVEGSWRVDEGWLTGRGQILCAFRFDGPQRLEYDARSGEKTAGAAGIGDLSAMLATSGVGLADAYFFGFGCHRNKHSKLMARGEEIARHQTLIKPSVTHHVVCEWDGEKLTHIIDGEVACTATPEERLSGTMHQMIGFYLWEIGQLDNVKVYTRTGKASRAGQARIAGKDGVDGPTGRLVYTATRKMGYTGSQGGWAIANAIMAIDASGKNSQQLRRVKGRLWSPSWSPDGARVAFCHYANGRGQIYVVNADGSGATNLSSNAYCDRSPVWSPDGTGIAFVSDRDNDWEIYVMKADGSAQKRLTTSPGMDQNPSWSPDGTQIAFESARSGVDVDIWVTAQDGSNQRPAIARVGNVEEPAWSPDGKRIAAVGIAHPWRGELLVKDVNSDAPAKRIMFQPHIEGIRWSPDGRSIAGVYRGPQERDTAGVFAVNADGTGERFLVRAGGIRVHPGGGREPHPSWYSSGGASPRWVVKTFGGVSWSPGGKYLAFSSDMSEDGAFYVYTILAEGDDPTRLGTSQSAWLQQTMWQP